MRQLNIYRRLILLALVCMALPLSCDLQKEWYLEVPDFTAGSEIPAPHPQDRRHYDAFTVVLCNELGLDVRSGFHVIDPGS